MIQPVTTLNRCESKLATRDGELVTCRLEHGRNHLHEGQSKDGTTVNWRDGDLCLDSYQNPAAPNGAVRSDAGKLRVDLFSPVALEGLAAVLTFGATKYDEHNWRKGMKWSRCIASLLRHTFALMRGEDIDPESGKPHVDHIQCNAHFLSEYQKLGTGTDDRWRSP